MLRIFGLIYIILSTSLSAKTTIHHRPARGSKDLIFIYENDILKAILNKTILEFGEYELVPLMNMNTKRSMEIASSNSIENYVFHTALSNELIKKYAHVPIPIMKGIAGYRVFLTSSEVKKKLKEIKTIKELKELSIGQGMNWSDTKILRHNGFEVKEHHRYSSLFPKVATGRFDLFPRGANEILGEIEDHKKIKNLVVDEKFVLYYPLPRVFYTHAKNKKLIKRLTAGLNTIISDGTLDQIWHKRFFELINRVNIKKRTIFVLQNPLLEGLDHSYLKYIHNFHY